MENSPRFSRVKNLFLRGGATPADPDRLFRSNYGCGDRGRYNGPLMVLHAQQGGDGAHEYGRLCRGRDVPAQQDGLSLRGVGPPAKAGDLIRAKSLGRKWEPLAVNFFFVTQSTVTIV